MHFFFDKHCEKLFFYPSVIVIFFSLDFNEHIYTFNQHKIDTDANSHHRNGTAAVVDNIYFKIQQMVFEVLL